MQIRLEPCLNLLEKLAIKKNKTQQMHKKNTDKEKTNSGYKHNKKVSHGIINLTFRMLQHTSSEVTVTRYDEI